MKNIGFTDIQNLAHLESSYAQIDPFYSRDEITTDLSVPWFYGKHELDCYRLDQMRCAVQNARLKVGYPGTFKNAENLAYFRFRGQLPESLYFRASGRVAVSIDGTPVYESKNETELHAITPTGNVNSVLLIEVYAENDLPALYVENKELHPEWSDDLRHWSDAVIEYSDSEETPPHKMPVKVEKLKPESVKDGVYDFGREVYGHVIIESKQAIYAGESLDEVRNCNEKHMEQSTDITKNKDGSWRSINPLAFRYVRTNGDAKLRAEIPVQPFSYRGAFACSDECLTRIWAHSSYTLKLCMQDFILDGVKRDRLPWVGDLAMSMMVNASVFGNEDIIRRTLNVLGRAGISKSHLNGIIDYSLWWIISHELYQQYFDDQEYLRGEWTGIVAAMEHLQKCCDKHGLLQKTDDDWLFIDWVDTDKLTALQILWQWALQAAAKLAQRVDRNDLSGNWRKMAESLGARLFNTSWDQDKKLWYGIPDNHKSAYSRHALFLSIISGLLPKKEYESAKSHLLSRELPSAGTPYMTGFEHIALSRLGAVSEMLERTRLYWGGMLKRGATTFWEAYDPEEQGEECWSFYGRPFGKSLCHAWSAGPAAFLSQGIIGLTPLEDGFRRFSISPCLDGLSWLAFTFPTPHGDISIAIHDGEIHMHIPNGLVCEYNDLELSGSCSVQLKNND